VLALGDGEAGGGSASAREAAAAPPGQGGEGARVPPSRQGDEGARVPPSCQGDAGASARPSDENAVGPAAPAAAAVDAPTLAPGANVIDAATLGGDDRGARRRGGPAAGAGGAGLRGPAAGAGRAGPQGLPAARWDRYEIVGRLGAGGMGEVFEARDTRLGRAVALKFLRNAGPEQTLRFLQEARTQARVDHPNVCKVYEVGRLSGEAYIAMQLVRGRRLDEAAAEMGLAAKVQAMKEIAEAVHEAHRIGIVHRDLKPSNVVVARGDDGRFTPVVMDFGLAYEADRGHGLTVAGALLGTPAYMAPEQARGELASVDRRSDVYSLGATLYELLTGAPPFDGAAATLLVRVLNDEPAPPRARAPNLPRDLETIALKCLQKDPERRYPSARALADDLGRFIDGEPIVGRRPSPIERWARRARRHKAATAVAGLSAAAAIAFGAFAARARLEARGERERSAARAQAAQQLGQQAKEAELFLRAAYALPLHDTGPARAYVRDRMARVAARGEADGALGHYALGRGHLALGEFDEARAELERARRQGFDSPELAFALGRSLGEIYAHSLAEARRGGGSAWAAGRRRALEIELLEPARRALEQSAGVELDSPRYLEGLLAFYRDDFDAAAAAAERACAEAPWAYEARRLAGDVAYARAERRFERGEYDAARDGVAEAIGLYERAAEVGRSDASTYEALAEAWLRRAEADERQGRPRDEPLGRALEAADRAVAAAPDRARGHARRAQVLFQRYQLARFGGGGGDPAALLASWIASAERAAALDPRLAYAHDALGHGHSLRGLQQVREGGDPSGAWGLAIASFGRALAIAPNYPWALHDLALVYRWRGDYGRGLGRDPGADYDEARRLFGRAIESDPKYLFAYENLADLGNAAASEAAARGADPTPHIEGALAAAGGALALDENYYAARNHLAVAELTRAEYLFDAGGDAAPPLGRALEHLARSSATNPSFAWTSFHRGSALLLLARVALREGRDPSADLAASRRALAEALRGAPDCVDCLIAGARAGVVEAAWARRGGRMAAALAALRRALDEARRAARSYPHPETHQAVARVCWRLADALPDGSPRRDAVDEGLRQADLALAADGASPHARALRAALLAARARAEAPSGREVLRAAARFELDRAFALNPLFRREYDDLARELGPAAP
jgi:eukaryotic-like serine/threonine-protein kinase